MSDKCRACGSCCRTFPVYASEGDAQREPAICREALLLARHLRTEKYAYKLFPLPFHEQCCFLGGDRLCRIYDNRPQVCRLFKPGSDQCLQARVRNGQPADS